MVLTSLNGEFMGFADGFFGFGCKIVKTRHGEQIIRHFLYWETGEAGVSVGQVVYRRGSSLIML